MPGESRRETSAEHASADNSPRSSRMAQANPDNLGCASSLSDNTDSSRIHSASSTSSLCSAAIWFNSFIASAIA
ncbi:hypothetical protein D1872_254660 [compost metagenome]